MSRRVFCSALVFLAGAGCNSIARSGYHETQARKNEDRLKSYANLPFAIGRCGNIGKSESEYLDLNVDDIKRDWYRDRGFGYRPSYGFHSSIEVLSDDRPAKQYARWSTVIYPRLSIKRAEWRRRHAS